MELGLRYQLNYYSDTFDDDRFVYQNVIVPGKYSVRSDQLLSEPQWRQLGIHMGSEWEHYEKYYGSTICAGNAGWTLMFRRPITSVKSEVKSEVKLEVKSEPM